MTVKKFIELDEMEQAEAIWAGKQMGQRLDGEYQILLYNVGGLYIEVQYDPKINMIRKFTTYNTIEELMPYLGLYDNL